VQVRAALPDNAPETTLAIATLNVRPALPAALPLMVQIATTVHPEDADALVSALRKRGYPATAHREPTDNLIYVRIGPFYSRDEANQWRVKLLDDGYKAMIQP
jgi:cell division septation protein DedD